MIVTPEGLHVFPEDVERVLDELPGVRESAVVGLAHDGQERVHAVVALEPGASQSASCIARGAWPARAVSTSNSGRHSH